MASEVLEDVGGLLSVETRAPSSSTTVKLFKPDNATSYSVGGATESTVSQSIASVTSNSVFTVSSTTGFYRGLYWLDTADGWEGQVRVSDFDSTSKQVTLSAPPPIDIEVGDVLKGLRNTYTVSSADAADRALHYRAEWTTYETEEGVAYTRKYTTVFHVTRMQFERPITPEELFSYASVNFAGATVGWSPGYVEHMAQRASDRVTRVLEGAGAYPHLLGDPRAFKDAGIVSARLELAREGLVPPGHDPEIYEATTRESVRREVHDALRALQWYDKDDSGTVDGNEVSSGYAVGLRRT